MARLADHEYKARLGAVLRRRDPEALHLFLRQSAAGYGDERQVTDVEGRGHQEMEELMCRMTLARSDLADLHAESRAWLAARGLPIPLPTRRGVAASPDARSGAKSRTRPSRRQRKKRRGA